MNISDLDYQEKVEIKDFTILGGRRIQVFASAIAVGNVRAITFVKTLAGAFSARF